jgi:hypothetical protein
MLIGRLIVLLVLLDLERPSGNGQRSGSFLVVRLHAEPDRSIALPDAPSVIVIHDSSLVAVQPQPVSAETATSPGPPSSPIFCSVGLIEYVQLPGA